MRHLALRASSVAVVAALALSACGSNDDSSSGTDNNTASGNKTVTIGLLADLTGAAAFCGVDVKAGAEAAVKQVNSSGMIPGVTLALDEVDDGTDPAKAASGMSQIASSDDVSSIYGCASALGLAAAPIAQQEQIPLVGVQVGDAGFVENGNYVFRTTVPQSTFQKTQVDYWVSKGVKTVAIAYQSDNPTLTQLANDIYPKLLSDAGIQVVKTATFKSDTVDFSAVASAVVGAQPDAILAETQGTPTVGLVTALDQAGFKGLIGGSAGFSGGVLAPLGDKANGLTYPSDFHPSSTVPATQDFVKKYTAITGTDASKVSQFVAEAWDSVMFTAQAMANTSDLTRSNLRDSMDALSQQGFTGAVGPLTFQNRSALLDKGLLLEWENGGTQLVG